MIHFMDVLAREYAWLIIFLCKAEWWSLHCRPLIAAALGYDAVKYLAWPQLRRAWWMHTMPEPPVEEPCS